MSTEDGECIVERDLAEFREAKMVHRTANVNFLDDILMLRLNGPKPLAECEGKEAHSCSGLTPLSRECQPLAGALRRSFRTSQRQGHICLGSKGEAEARVS